MADVDRITLYPVKALDGVDDERSCVTDAGLLAGDHEYFHHGPDGAPVDGKRTARLHDLATAFDRDVGRLTGIVDDDGRVLVMRRVGNRPWGIPGGYTDAGETPAGTAVREAREETGLEVEPEELVTFVYREPDTHNPHGFAGGVYRCSVVGGTLSGSHESDELGYRRPDEVPAWHTDHGEVARQVLDGWRTRRD